MAQSRPPLVRIQFIDEQLKARRYPNCTSVARHFEVSTKSIQRDIEYMRDVLHAPLAYDHHMRGYYYEKPGWAFLPTTILERREAEALEAARKVLAHYKGSPFYDEICRALDKLRRYLPDNTLADGLFEIYTLEHPHSEAIEPRHLARIEDAIRGRRKLAITYRAAWNQEESERTIHPYRMHHAASNGLWYLIAYCELRSELRTFAIGRIRTLSLTRHRFTIPEHFSMERYLEQSFQETHHSGTHAVAIRFTPYQAQWIRERSWHPTQALEEHPDGSLTLRLEVGALEAVKRWVLRYGAEALVQNPPELREMILHELMRMQERYGASR